MPRKLSQHLRPHPTQVQRDFPQAAHMSLYRWGCVWWQNIIVYCIYPILCIVYCLYKYDKWYNDFGDGIQRRVASSFDIHLVGCDIWDPGCPLGKSAEMKFPSSRVHKLLEWVSPSSAKLSWFDFLLMQFDVKAKIIFATLIWSGNKSLDLLCSDVVGLGFPSPLSSLILKNMIDNDYPGSGICKRLIVAKKDFFPQYIQK